MPKPQFDPNKPFETINSKPQFDPNKPFSFVDEKPAEEMSFGQQAAQSLRSAAEGATFGLSEPVISGLMAVEQNIQKSAKESGGLSEFVKKITDPERIKKEYSLDVERRRQFEQQNPMLSGSAEMVGAIAPAALTGGSSALAKGLSAVPNVLSGSGQAISQGLKSAPIIGKALSSPGIVGSISRIGETALTSGAQALGAESLKRGIEGATGFIKGEDNLPSLGETAAFGAKFGGALASIPELASQSARFGKYVANIFTGVKPRDVDYYLANQKAVQNAPSIGEIKNQLDDTIFKLNDDVDNAKISVDQAKATLSEAKDNLNEAIKNNKNISAQEKSNLRIALKEAQNDFNLAWKAKLSEIKSARIPLQPDDVLDSVEAVKKQVSDLSEQSYQILDDFKGKFDISDLNKEIGKLQNSLKVEGSLMSKDSQNAYKVLQRWKDNISGKGFVKGPAVKAIIQEIDSDLRLAGDRLAGEYSDKTYNSLMGVRRLLDEKIKSVVPGYKEIMSETAAMNLLRGELSKTFGRRENVVSKLSRIDNPNLKYEQNLLIQLGELTGKDFNTPIQDFAKLKSQGATQIAQETAKQSLPEYQAMQLATRREGATRSPQYGQAREQFIMEKGPEAQAYKQALKLVDNSLESLNVAKDKLQPFKNLSPGKTEGFIKELIGNPRNGIERRKLADALGKMSETDFLTMIDNLRTKEAFNKSFTHGSRNVNAWGAIGAVIGFLTGDINMVPTLGGSGVVLGQITDQYGPAMTRKVLDGMLKIKANPTVQNINDTFHNIPPELKERLKTDLTRLTNIYSNTSAIDRRMTDMEKR